MSICGFCTFIWGVASISMCTYLVFWMNQSGWWYALALLLAAAWSCSKDKDVV